LQGSNGALLVCEGLYCRPAGLSKYRAIPSYFSPRFHPDNGLPTHFSEMSTQPNPNVLFAPPPLVFASENAERPVTMHLRLRLGCMTDAHTKLFSHLQNTFLCCTFFGPVFSSCLPSSAGHHLHGGDPPRGEDRGSRSPSARGSRPDERRHRGGHAKRPGDGPHPSPR